MVKAYAYPYSMAMAACGWRTASRVLSNAAHQRIPSSMTRVISPKLSRSDFVQWGKLGKLLSP
jgi:hypothetical protein